MWRSVISVHVALHVFTAYHRTSFTKYFHIHITILHVRQWNSIWQRLAILSRLLLHNINLPHILLVHAHALVQLFLMCMHTHTHTRLCNSYCFVIFRIFRAIHLIGASEVTRTFYEFSYTITFTRLPEIVKSMEVLATFPGREPNDRRTHTLELIRTHTNMYTHSCYKLISWPTQ